MTETKLNITEEELARALQLLAQEHNVNMTLPVAIIAARKMLAGGRGEGA